MGIEVGRGVRWLEVETEILQQGYAKVAVLGRDVVYVQIAELPRFAAWAREAGDWAQRAGSFLPELVPGAFDEGSPLAEAKATCDTLGDICAGVTCASKDPGRGCTPRAGKNLYASPNDEVSHLRPSRLM